MLNRKGLPWTGLRVVLTGMLISSISACTGPSVEVSEILNHSMCKTLKKGVSQVQFADLADIRGVQLLTEPSSETAPESGSESTSAVLLIAVSKGSQPTPGYGFKLLAVELAQENTQELQLQYTWLTPSPNAVMAQMVTSPCSVVQLDAPSDTGPSDTGPSNTGPSNTGTGDISTVSAWVDGEHLGRVSLTRS